MDRRPSLTYRIRSLVWALAMSALISAARAAPADQEKSSAAPSSARPAPQISGRLIGTGANGQLILEYKQEKGRGTFIGTTHSTCVIPAKSDSSQALPLDLSAIPK